MLSFKKYLEEERITEAATSGIYKWQKYFQGKEVETDLKKIASYYNKDLVKVGTLEKGTKIVALQIDDYNKLPKVGNSTLYPIRTDENKKFFIPFESINKPRSRAGSESPTFVRDKELIPATFGLADKTLTHDQLITATEKALSKLSIDKEVKKFCRKLFNAEEPTFTISSSLSDVDIKIILKDFGEIAAAAYLLFTNPAYDSVTFPKANLPLIDFILNYPNGEIENFSVKSNKGSKPTISSLIGELDKLSEVEDLTTGEKRSLAVIKIINGDSLYEGPLKAAKYLKTPGYLALIELLSKYKAHSGSVSDDIPSKEALQSILYNMNGTKKKAILEFYSKAGFKPTEKSMMTNWGSLHYPITSELVKWLNADVNGATRLITLAANRLSVSQIYVDKLGKEKYGYIIKPFKEAKFKFGSPSSIRYPLNNRIGFTMIK
mgnify:CR=1 FL=1